MDYTKIAEETMDRIGERIAQSPLLSRALEAFDYCEKHVKFDASDMGAADEHLDEVVLEEFAKVLDNDYPKARQIIREIDVKFNRIVAIAEAEGISLDGEEFTRRRAMLCVQELKRGLEEKANG